MTEDLIQKNREIAQNSYDQTISSTFKLLDEQKELVDECFGEFVTLENSTRSIKVLSHKSEKSLDSPELTKATCRTSKKGSIEFSNSDTSFHSSGDEQDFTEIQVSGFSEILSEKSIKSLQKSNKDMPEDKGSCCEYKEELSLMKIFDCESIKEFSYQPYLISKIENQTQEIQAQTETSPNEPVNTLTFNAEEEKTLNKPLILNCTQRRFIGNLKFYDEKKGFGFITVENDPKDTFIHHDDLLKADIDIKQLKTTLKQGVIMISFSYLEYMGKYNRSKKAVD